MASLRHILATVLAVLFGATVAMRGDVLVGWVGHHHGSGHHTVSFGYTHSHTHSHHHAPVHHSEHRSHETEAGDYDDHSEHCCDAHHHHVPEGLVGLAPQRDRELFSAPVAVLSEEPRWQNLVVSWLHRPPWPPPDDRCPSHLTSLRTVVLLT